MWEIVEPVWEKSPVIPDFVTHWAPGLELILLALSEQSTPIGAP